MKRTAIISDCERYRYRLVRHWDGMFEDSKSVNFIMLNPSTADAKEDDPTIRRCIGFAKAWGYNELVVTNMYAFRATKPEDLWTAPDPVGPENKTHLVNCALAADLVVLAWGAHGATRGRGRVVLELLRTHSVSSTCLDRTRDGEPRHPLYLKADLTPKPFVFTSP